MAKKNPNSAFKATSSDSNYATKAISEFTIMTTEELKNWEEIQQYLKSKKTNVGGLFC